MYILGLNYPGHDTSVCLTKDNIIVAAVEEERLNREKHTRKFPTMAIDYCLKTANITINDLSAIVVNLLPERVISDKLIFHTFRFPQSVKLLQQNLPLVSSMFNLKDEIREKTGFKGTITFDNHHQTHFGSAYYISKFKECALLSIDGMGEYQTSVTGYAKNGVMTTLKEVIFPDSLGLLYSAVTAYLGFKSHSDEGKIMGLAPYGEPKTYINAFRKMVHLTDDGLYNFDLSYFTYPFERNTWVTEKFVSELGPRRAPESAIDQRHMDIAAALQQILEETVLHMCRHLYEQTKSENLCIIGGCALNCVLNGKILMETPFKQLGVQPASGDAGTAIGAALNYYYRMNPDKLGNHVYQKSTSLGPQFSEAECLKAIEKSGLKYRKSKNVSTDAAKLLADGKILGWFHGRMEFGPRALGNRSIITAPHPAEMKDILNEKVKHREGFRPFAPAVLHEKAGEYFEMEHESPYMLLAFPVRKSQQAKLGAITHVDETARVQTVTPDINKRYYDLIKAFGDITGTYVILNTSFNRAGEPMVCSPEDAIATFTGTYMDYLVLEDFIVSKTE